MCMTFRKVKEVQLITTEHLDFYFAGRAFKLNTRETRQN
jgi:hypothetical protein